MLLIVKTSANVYIVVCEMNLTILDVNFMLYIKFNYLC